MSFVHRCDGIVILSCRGVMGVCRGRGSSHGVGMLVCTECCRLSCCHVVMLSCCTIEYDRRIPSMKYKYYNEYCTPVTVANREVDGCV